MYSLKEILEDTFVERDELIAAQKKLLHGGKISICELQLPEDHPNFPTCKFIKVFINDEYVGYFLR